MIKELKKVFKDNKLEGISRRWLYNIFGAIVIILIIALVVSSFFVKNYYYNSVENILKSGASQSAVSYFSNSIDKGKTLESSASDFIDSYVYKEKTTIWVIDNQGQVIVSSNGFDVDNKKMPDFYEAMSNSTGTSTYTGKISDNGEKVMAVTRVITNNDNVNIGAVRVMTNISDVDKQIASVIFVIFVIILFVFFIILFSNLFFIRSIIIPIKDINNTTKEIANGNFDIRIYKKYDDEIGDLADSINTMATEISAADTMKNDFISTISHELRTPLTSIKGWAETLYYGQGEDADQLTVKGLDVIVKEAGRLEGFVEELLDFSRLQSGRMTLHTSKIDIFAELDETVFTFRERAMREGIEVKYSIPDFAAQANADSNRLKQVFMNILDNALKYSRAPSKIFVKAEFSKLDNRDCVRISIADQGCGISKEDLPHVMEKFYKANVSVRGSGIGLAVTNEIINLHSGKLEIDSEEGKGTLVTIYLPVETVPSKKDLALSENVEEEVSDDDIDINSTEKNGEED